MHWRSIGYAVACIVTPVAWGMLVVQVSTWVESVLRKRRLSDSTGQEESPLPPIDYHI